MRRELVMVGIFFLFSFSFVAAANCEDGQTIMRLYSATNSHVSAWDQNSGAYVEEICYNETFGIPYPGADNYPHACSGDNRVLSVYDYSNSHASQASDATYDKEICYGDLECTYEAGSCSDGVVVAKLSDTTNAHVSDPSSSYPISICCTSEESVAEQVYWANPAGERITNASIGDTVYMVSRWTSSGTFKILEEDNGPIDFFDDDIRDVVGEAVGNNLIGTWKITQADLQKTSGDFDDFYFLIGGVKSDSLEVFPIADDDPMEISILSPNCGKEYDKGATVDISVSATDDDDTITGNISINGESVNFGNGGITVRRVFDTPGNIKIVAYAENTRGAASKVISNVMVLDKVGSTYVAGDYVAACIDEPENFEYIMGSKVKFDASSTRGVVASGGNSYTVLVPGTDSFSWYWTFNPGNIQQNNLNTAEEIGHRFSKEFPSAGRKTASLRVEI